MGQRLQIGAAIALALGVLTLLAARNFAQAEPTSRKSAACGRERWSVKTLTDPAARLINFHPRHTTVSALRRLAPTGLSVRGVGAERTTYTIRARLSEAKLEEDEDYHLVVTDLRHHSQTMILEFPSGDCTRRSMRRQQMARARAAFVRACGSPSSTSLSRLRGEATITGVGFFDVLHGQTGVAPNGIELHPVLAFTRADCR
jgi:hypothetical protein